MKHLISAPLLLALTSVSLAQSGVQSDDFNTPELDSVWSFVDARGDATLSLVGLGTFDANVRVDLPAGPSHDLWWNANFAPRLLQSSGNTDLILEAKFDSIVDERYEMQGIIVQESFGRFLRFEVYHDGNEPHIFVAVVVEGSEELTDSLLNTRLVNTYGSSEAPSTLRVDRSGNTWSLWTLNDAGEYFPPTLPNGAAQTDDQPFATFDYDLTVTEVGVHLGNHPPIGSTPAPAFTGLVDYFVNLEEPLDVEDGPFDLDPPIADAGQSRTVHLGEVVPVNGSGSLDMVTASGDLVYQWTLSEAPTGSLSQISNPSSPTPTITIDSLGTYVIQLVVVDGAGLASEPAVIELSSENQVPTADAGTEEIVRVGEALMLDALGSSDADGDTLSYSWTLLSAPEGSAAVLAGADTALPTLVPDVSGDYLVQLVVRDPYSNSIPATVTVTATDPLVDAQLCLGEVSHALRTAPWSSFLRWYLRFTVHRQVRLAAFEIRCGHYGQANDRLEKLLWRLDGCVLRGQPDGWATWLYGIDWVVDCELQNELYAKLTDVQALISD